VLKDKWRDGKKEREKKSVRNAEKTRKGVGRREREEERKKRRKKN